MEVAKTARGRLVRSVALALGLLVWTGVAVSAKAQTITTYAGGAFPANNTTPYSVPHPTAMARDASGNLYVASGDPTGSQFGSNNSVVRGNRIFRIAPNGNVTLIAGNGQFPGSTPNNVVATQAPISLPAGIAVDTANPPNVYFSDESQSLVFKVTAATGILTIVAGNGANTGENIAAATAQVSGPTGLAIDGTARLFIGVKNENRVRVVNLSNNTISTFAGPGAPATGAPILRDDIVFQPRGLYYDAGIVYIAMPGFNQIRTASTSGQAIIVGAAGSGFDGDGGPAASAKLRSPAGVAKEGADIFIADTGNQRIRKIDSGGNISTVAGSVLDTGGFTLPYGFAGDGGPATNAFLDGPSDVRGIGSGNFVIADRGNHRIRIVNGGTITTLAGNGSWGFNGDGVARGSAQLAFPARGEFDAAGNLYFVEMGNNRVRRIAAATGLITTVAGTGLAGYNGDNIAATSANLSDPSDVALDTAGNLYIADKNAARIRRVDASTGMITTVAGTGVVGSSGDGGPATSAQLFTPSGILIDSTGALLIADPTFGINRVRKVIIGGNITAFAGAASGCAGGGSGVTTGDGQAPTAAGSCLTEPRDIVEVKDTENGLVAGDFLIAEKSVVRRISSNVLSTYAGSPTTVGDAVGTPASARFRDIESLALDSLSNIFTVESFSRKVKKITGGTGQVSAYAGDGTFNYDGDNQAATNAALFNPFGIFINTADEVHIADTRNHRIRKVVSLPDLLITKSNNTSNTAALGASWTWTLRVQNLGSLAASFTSGQNILTDNLPSADLSYSLGAITNVVGVTNSGNISCSIDGSKNLTCSATGPVDIAAATGRFDVPITVTSTATGSYTNPRSGGVCSVDTGSVITELSEANNTSSNTVTVTAPNLRAFKTNDVGGTVNPPGPWTWRIATDNTGNANAAFADGQVIFRDDLPNTNISYSAVTMDADIDLVDYDGTIACSINGSSTLTCTASGGPVTFYPGTGFYAEFTATPSSGGTFANPRSSGSCGADPDNLISESNEANNSCSDTVVAMTPNDSPVANDDSGSIDEDDTLLQGPPGVLANDTDSEGDPLTASLVTGAANGTVNLDSDGGYSYEPNPNYSGPDSFTYKVNDGFSDSNTATVNLTVNAIADAPVITDSKPASVTMSEDGSPSDFSLTLNATDADGDTITWSISSPASNGTATASGTGTSKSIGYTPNADYNGSDSFTVEVSDGNGGSDTIVVNVTIEAVNDAPAITDSKPAAVTMSEDGSPTAFSLTLNATDPDGDTITWGISSPATNGTATASGTGASQTIDYTPNADYNGSDSFTVEVSDGNGGADSIVVNVTIEAVNDAPTFQIASDPPAVNEDAGAQTVSNFVTNFSPGPANESSQTLVGYSVTQTESTGNLTLSSGPTIDNNGTLTYTPTANTSGTLTFDVTATDSGDGTAPNENTSAAVSFTVTVNGENDAPVLDATGAMSLTAINEDVPAASNSGTLVSDVIASAGGDRITDVDAGAVEGLAITDSTTANGTWEFSTDGGANWSALGVPTPSSARLLAADANTRVRFLPNTNFNGTIDPALTFRAWDQSTGTNGGTADTSTNGGTTAFSTNPEAASITVNAANDAPSFTKGADQTVNEDAGAQTVSGWATNISPGPSDESGQTVSFTATNNNNALFSAQPAVSSSGTLTYTPAANANGTATVTVTATDTGGTANGGSESSAGETFLITINAVNDAPSFTKGPDQTMSKDAGPQSVSGWATNISAGPANESAQNVSFAVTNNNNALFAVQPAVSSTGTLTYDPNGSSTGTVTVSVTASDNGGTDNGGQDTSGVQAFTITLNADATPTPSPSPSPSPSPTASPSPSASPSPGTSPSPSASPSPSPSDTPSQTLNISTRARVETGDRVMIAGTIITGNAAKRVIVRALGPSLTAEGINDALADPVLQLYGPNGSLITTNDNWKDSQQADIQASNLAPDDDRESAIIATLMPNNYTAVVSGRNGTSGVALAEIYDLDTAADSELANISTRAFVQTGENVMIGGFMLGGTPGSSNVVVRGLGPSLSQSGVSNTLADPTLELRDANGTLLLANDNWQDDPAQAAQITATGVPPPNAFESALTATLQPGDYTAILAGKNSASGVGLVEIYNVP